MKHLGDITKINWFEVAPVDCVTGGSPCQDLSVAGKRAGLAGERSGLYMEQIRCIKELRQQDVNNGRTGAMVRPRWMVWENVPGAFSSNGGKDFAAVLEEAVKIVEPQAPSIPVPDKGWPSAGCLYDVDGRWSIAWRVHDAQFWGVPQRRKRIALVCDFGGMSAPEVLFERKGLSRDSEQSGAEREETARTAGSGIENAHISDYTAICTYQQVTGPLMANSHPGSYCGQDAYSDMLVTTADCRNGYENIELSGTLQAKENGGQSLNYINPVRCGQTVRRLTPLECERLQGYPDGWTDIGDWTDSKGKKHKAADSPRYKALGNSIALPFWFWLLRRISAQYERPATLGSLFDGIGGFPLCWERCNGKGTALWASEIEEFPMAVTKIRFSLEQHAPQHD